MSVCGRFMCVYDVCVLCVNVVRCCVSCDMMYVDVYVWDFDVYYAAREFNRRIGEIAKCFKFNN